MKEILSIIIVLFTLNLSFSQVLNPGIEIGLNHIWIKDDREISKNGSEKVLFFPSFNAALINNFYFYQNFKLISGLRFVHFGSKKQITSTGEFHQNYYSVSQEEKIELKNISIFNDIEYQVSNISFGVGLEVNYLLSASLLKKSVVTKEGVQERRSSKDDISKDLNNIDYSLRVLAGFDFKVYERQMEFRVVYDHGFRDLPKSNFTFNFKVREVYFLFRYML